MRPTTPRLVFTLAVLLGINTMNFFDRQILPAVQEKIRQEWPYLTDSQLGWLGTAFILSGPLQLEEIRLETGRGLVPVRLERGVGVAHPLDVAVGLGVALEPDRVDVHVVGGVALVEGGVLLGAGDGPAELEDDGVGLGRGER